MFEIQELCDHAGVLNEGRLVASLDRAEMEDRDPAELEQLLTEAMA